MKNLGHCVRNLSHFDGLKNQWKHEWTSFDNLSTGINGNQFGISLPAITVVVGNGGGLGERECNRLHAMVSSSSLDCDGAEMQGGVADLDLNSARISHTISI